MTTNSTYSVKVHSTASIL